MQWAVPHSAAGAGDHAAVTRVNKLYHAFSNRYARVSDTQAARACGGVHSDGCCCGVHLSACSAAAVLGARAVAVPAQRGTHINGGRTDDIAHWECVGAQKLFANELVARRQSRVMFGRRVVELL